MIAALLPLFVTLVQEIRTYLQIQEDEEQEKQETFERYLMNRWEGSRTKRGEIASRAISKYLEDTAGDVPVAEAQRQMEEGLAELLSRPLTEERILEHLREAAGTGAETDEAALGDAAKEMAAALAESGGSPMQGILLELLLETKTELGGGISEEDQDLIIDCLGDIARRRPFRLGHVQEETRGFYVMPPVKCEKLPDGPDPVTRVTRYLSSEGQSRLFIRGPAGIGKTRFVAEVTRLLATRKEGAIPLFAAPEEHARWDSGSDVFDWLCEMLNTEFAREQDVFECAAVKRACMNHRSDVVFVLDGLDQADRAGVSYLLTHRDALQRFSWVVAGREEGFRDLPDFRRHDQVPVLDMQFFEEEHVRQFIDRSRLDSEQAHHGAYARFSLDEFDNKDEAHRTYNTPLMLTFLVELALDAPPDAEPPNSELDLFDAYIRKLAERGREIQLRRGDALLRCDEVIRIWRNIAYEALCWWDDEEGVQRPQVQHLCHDFVNDPRVKEKVLRTSAAPWASVDMAYEWGIMWHSDMFEGRPHDPGAGDETLPGDRCFMHLTLQEYLAARRLVGDLRRLVPRPDRTPQAARALFEGRVLSERGLLPWARPNITKNTARMLAEMLSEKEVADGDGTSRWIDGLLEWLLAECEELVHENDPPASGARRRNTHRSNLLYTAMAVRNERYSASLERFQGAEAPPTCPHGCLERLWKGEWEEARARQEEHAEKIAHLEANWPEVLAPYDKWAVLPPGISLIGGLEYEWEQPIRKLRFPIEDDAGVLLMCRHPVTNAQYRQFAEETGYTDADSESALPHLRHWQDDDWAEFRGADKPVVYVSWEDARRYCRWLDAQVECTVDLPAELLWEHACRAGSTTEWCFGNDERKLPDYAWYRGNSEGHTRAVEGLEPNAWGLRDMHGNVWEWCRDWFGEDSYELRPTESPKEGPSRMLRGGSWSYFPGYCRSAYRSGSRPIGRSYGGGFRVLLRVRE